MSQLTIPARRLACALLGLALASGLAACGKYAGPSQPGPPDQITFPKTYPTH